MQVLEWMHVCYLLHISKTTNNQDFFNYMQTDSRATATCLGTFQKTIRKNEHRFFVIFFYTFFL